MWSTTDLVRYLVRCQLLAGNFYALRKGRVLFPIHPERVTTYAVYTPRDGRLVERLYKVMPPNTRASASWLDSLRQIDEGEAQVYTSAEMFHVPGFGFDGTQGYSKITTYATSLDTMGMVERTTNSFYKNGSQMSGFLKTDRTLKVEQATLMKERWQEKISGVDNAGEIAVLDGGVTFEPVSISPVDAELLATRRFSIEDVARIFGVPSIMLNESGNGFMAGAGVDALNRFFLTQTIEPLLTSIEPWLTRELPSGQVARFDRTILTKPEPKVLAQTLAIYRDRGIMTVNEQRKQLGLPAIKEPWADDPRYVTPKPDASAPAGQDGSHGGGSDAEIAP
ncbi:MAG: phage portal protein [Acidimicrobiales bacterium]